MTPGGPGGGQGTQESGEPVTELPSTTCWRDLERFNEAVTLETFRNWAAPLLASGDKLILTYLKERLIELIGNDVNHANQVLDWAQDAGRQEFGVLLSALKASPAVHQPQVAGKLLSLSFDDTIDPARRAGFLVALETQHRFEPAVIDRLADFPRSPSAGEAGWVATRTLGRVMAEDQKRMGNAAPYLDKLLTISAESLDENVRYLAMEMPMHADVVLDASSTERLAKILTTEGSEQGRQVAAHDLSLAQDKKQVLDIYAKAFETERDVCVRWALFRFAARAAGRNALPVMANMAMTDPRFQPDYQTFERIYASGIRDFERVWLNLPDQDPHGCLDRHE